MTAANGTEYALPIDSCAACDCQWSPALPADGDSEVAYLSTVISAPLFSITHTFL